jgi:signal transduction histidine kinase
VFIFRKGRRNLTKQWLIRERRSVKSVGSTEARLNRSLRTLYRCNRLVFEASSEHELLQTTCEILVETGGLRLAWIGYCGDDADKSVWPVAMAGYGVDFLDCVKFSWGNTGTGIGIAIRTGAPCLIEDIRTDPNFSHGRTEAVARGYASCLTLPLTVVARSQGTPDLRGTLSLYTDADDSFDESAIELYTNLASYLTYAVITLRSNWAHSFTSEVTVLRNKQERSRAEAALQASEIQRYLMEAERLSGLGGLVAGVAHELSTPIGNSLTVASSFARRCDAFAAEAAAGQVRRSRLTEFIKDSLDGAGKLVADLERAGGLIHAFSQVAVDRSGANRRPFDLKLATEQIISSLRPGLRKSQLSLSIAIPDSIIMDSYPGSYGQVLTDLVINATVHGFANAQGGNILIEARQLDGEKVEISFSDNGRGMTEDVLHHAFDPFFTTCRPQGHTGLGLFIVHNIVTQQLGGRITLTSAPAKGTTFRITLPLVAPMGQPSPDAPPSSVMTFRRSN